MNSDYIIYALMAVGVFTVYMAIVQLFRRDRMRDRLKSVGAFHEQEEEEEETVPLLAAFCAAVVSMLEIDLKAQKPLVTMLSQAGIHSPHAVAYFLFVKRIIQPIVLLLGAALGAYVFMHMDSLSKSDKIQYMILVLICGVFGYSGANLYVTNRRQHRQHILLRSFPETLDLLLVCIESGLGLDASLGRVCIEMRQSHVVITQELERTRVELTVLSDRSQALQNLAERTGIIPFKSLVAALIQTEKFGTSLLDTLRVLAEDQRTARLMNAEARAARIPVLITVPLIIFTLPALFIVILGPPFIKLSAQGGIFGDKK